MTGRQAPSLRGTACLMAALLGTTACSSSPPAQAAEPHTPAANAGSPKERPMESAKRRVPSVAPVTVGSTRYEVLRGARSRGFSQNGGIIAAVDTASGQELWTLVLYETVYDPQEEADVQDVFITSLALSKDGKQLLAKSENKKSYSVNLADRTITILP